MDGVPVTDHQLEAFDLNWLPLAATEQIEVAVNGQSSLYGSGASGGVADVASARAVPDIPVSEVVAWWGSSDSRAVSIGINRLITDSFGIVGAYENLHSGGWMDKSSANNNKFYGKLSGHAGGGLAYDIVGYRFDGDIELPDSCPNLPGTHPGTRADRRDFLTVQLAGGGDRSLHLDYHYLGTSQSFASKDTAYSNEGRLNGVSLVGTWRSADSTTTAIGTGFKRRDMLSTALGDRSSSDIFAYAAREVLTTGWRVKGILRAEKNSAFRAELAATLAASFLAHEKCRVFASLDRSFTFPSYNQLYWRGPDQPGDPRIGTEHWNGLEMGMDVGGNGFSVSATFFWKHIDNRAVWKTDESCQQYRVTDEAIDVKGLEASLGLKYPTWLEWSLSYAISHARDRSGDEVVYVPQVS
jgi:outer membrane cobalamin receptor